MSIPIRQAAQPSTDTFVLAVAGDVDLATAPAFKVLLESAAHAPATVVVDFSAVQFMDCSGLPPLLEAHARLGDRLQLRGLQPVVQRLLLLTGLGRLFDLPDQPQPDSASPDCVEGLRPVPMAATSGTHRELVPETGGPAPHPLGPRPQTRIPDRTPPPRLVPAARRAARP
jgi:anti-sigma B factor antagonist